jgi:hypothetical protein
VADARPDLLYDPGGFMPQDKRRHTGCEVTMNCVKVRMADPYSCCPDENLTGGWIVNLDFDDGRESWDSLDECTSG